MEKKFKNQSVQSKSDQLIRYYKVKSNLKKEDALNIVLSKIEKGEKSKYSGKRIQGYWITGLSAAAGIALLITFYIFTASVSFHGIDGQVTSVRLPDHSRVVLNNDSKISYRKYFWNRNLNLEGEAYFEVEKGSRFNVSTQSGNVEVLGTRFLVTETNQQMKVQCFEGKVKATLVDQSYLLTAGMKVEENPDGLVVLKENEMEGYPVFARFKKSYTSISLAEIAAELEQFFGVDISVQDSANRNFSGSLETGDFTTALEIITQSMQLNYKTGGNNKITIYKNN